MQVTYGTPFTPQSTSSASQLEDALQSLGKEDLSHGGAQLHVVTHEHQLSCLIRDRHQSQGLRHLPNIQSSSADGPNAKLNQ